MLGKTHFLMNLTIYFLNVYYFRYFIFENRNKKKIYITLHYIFSFKTEYWFTITLSILLKTKKYVYFINVSKIYLINVKKKKWNKGCRNTYV